jgi:hypothetical protein
MKEKDAHVDFEDHQVTLFVEKEDGSYGSVQTGSYLAKNYMNFFWENMNHFQKTALVQLLNNKTSPIAYYMTLKDMAPADVAVRVGISTSQVKKHMTPWNFKNMKLALAKKYAEIFGIPLANLFQIFSQPEQESTVVKQTETKNPYVVIIEKNEEK